MSYYYYCDMHLDQVMILATSVLQVLCKGAPQDDVRQNEEYDAHSLQSHLRGGELIRQKSGTLPFWQKCFVQAACRSARSIPQRAPRFLRNIS